MIHCKQKYTLEAHTALHFIYNTYLFQFKISDFLSRMKHIKLHLLFYMAVKLNLIMKKAQNAEEKNCI